MLNFRFKIRPFLLFQLFQKPDAAVGLVLMAMRVLSWSSSRVVVGVALGNGAPSGTSGSRAGISHLLKTSASNASRRSGCLTKTAKRMSKSEVFSGGKKWL
jgi:hypothetical protein